MWAFRRERDVYIANMVKCRPPKNRDPERDELDACMAGCATRCASSAPKSSSASAVAGCALIDPGFKVTRQHGEFFEKNGTVMMGTFHPAALLRNPANTPGALDDFVRLREKYDELT